MVNWSCNQPNKKTKPLKGYLSLSSGFGTEIETTGAKEKRIRKDRREEKGRRKKTRKKSWRRRRGRRI